MTSSPSLLGLPSAILGEVMAFLGPGHYRYVAATCVGLMDAYALQHPGNYLTSGESIVGSVATAATYISEMNASLEKDKKDGRPRKNSFFRHAFDLFRVRQPKQNESGDERWRAKGMGQFCAFVAFWAARYGRLEILKWLHHKKLGFHLAAGELGHLAEEASKGGHLNCFQYVVEDLGYKKFSTVNTQQKLLSFAAKNGHLAFLRHFREEEGLDFTVMKELCCSAAEGGNLEVLRYLFETAKCPWDYRTCLKAAQYGNLDCLIYARENGCDWSNPMAQNDASQRISCRAAQGGITCLEYVHKQGCELLHQGCVAMSAQKGHLDCLVYLHENGVDMCNQWALELATRNGHLDCLKYLFEINGQDCWEDWALEAALASAAGRGELDCLVYLTELEQVEWMDLPLRRALVAVAGAGHLTCITYLIGLDVGFNPWTLRAAVESAAVGGRCDCLSLLLKLEIQLDRPELQHIANTAKQLGKSDSAQCLFEFLETI